MSWRDKASPLGDIIKRRRWKCAAGHVTFSTVPPTRCEDPTCKSTDFKEHIRG